jgi:hypothetical protein
MPGDAVEDGPPLNDPVLGLIPTFANHKADALVGEIKAVRPTATIRTILVRIAL